MLEGLDDIPWSRLHHAYGDAADVPPFIRGLTSPDATVVRGALHELFGNIWHQGTVYSATPFAVPFLIEILRAGATSEPLGVLWLLAEIARGDGYYTVHARAPEDVPPFVDLGATLTEEAKNKGACRAAVRRGIDIFLELVGSEEPSARGVAIYGLAIFVEEPDVALALRAAADREQVPRLRAAAFLAMAFASEPPTGCFDADSAPLETLVRLARAGRVEREAVAQVLDSLITEDMVDALSLTSEILSDAHREGGEA